MAFDNIPLELRQLPQWVVWRYEDRGGEKPTKIPYSPNGGKAEVDNPTTWDTFDAALETLNYDEYPSGFSYSGIGFVLTADDPYAFIDLDAPKCSPEELPGMLAGQQKIAEAFNTYAELSPSGKGLHIICRGRVLTGKKKSREGVEIYSELRYMTMTGNVYRDAPVNDCQDLLQSLWSELGGADEVAKRESKPQVDDDATIYDRACCAKNGETFLKLWAGDWRNDFPSQSEADQALINILAFYTRNHEQIKRMFRLSGLGKRDKANDHNSDSYLQRTINRAQDRDIDIIDLSAFMVWFHSELKRHADEAAATEKKRIENIAATLEAKHEQATAAAIQAHERRHEATPYALAPLVGIGGDFEAPPGLLGEIAQFVYSQSPYPLPRTALVAAIAFLSALCGRAYNVNGLGCNLYTLLVAPTGAGKEAISSGISKLSLALREIVPASSTYFGLDQIASGQGLYVAIKERKSALSIQTEFGIELQNLTHPRAPSPIKLLKKAYLELFTKSGEGQLLGASAFADKTKNTDSLKSPCLSILGETAPPHLYDALNETMLADGLLPRFMLVEVDNGTDVFNGWAHTIKPSQALLTKVADLAAACCKMDHADRAIHVQMTEGAAELSEQYRAITKKTIDSQSKESGRQMWSRAHVKALKLAALVAVGCNPYAPTIDADALRWAICVVNDGTRRLMDRFERGDMGEGDARQSADVKRFLMRYCTENAHTLPHYAFSPEQHAQRCIGYSYIRQNVIQLASFRTAMGGSTQAFMRCLKSLCDEGLLRELLPEQVAKLGSFGKVYAIVDARLL